MRLLGPLALADVAEYERHGDRLAALVLDRGVGERYVDAPPVLGAPHRVVCRNGLIRLDERLIAVALVSAFRRDEERDTLANGFHCCPPEQPLRGGVPGEDLSVERAANDGVVGVLDDRRQAGASLRGVVELNIAPAQGSRGFFLPRNHQEEEGRETED